MVSLRKPTVDAVRAFLDGQRESPFSYPHVGATRGEPPAGWAVDRNRVRLGAGEAAFAAGCAALCRWKMFRLVWVELCWPDAPLAPGTVVAPLAHLFGLWWWN